VVPNWLTLHGGYPRWRPVPPPDRRAVQPLARQTPDRGSTLWRI